MLQEYVKNINENYKSTLVQKFHSESVDSWAESWVAETSDLGRPGPAETLTIAGLSRRSPRRKPRLNSSITMPSLNSLDSSRAIAS